VPIGIAVYFLPKRNLLVGILVGVVAFLVLQYAQTL